MKGSALSPDGSGSRQAEGVLGVPVVSALAQEYQKNFFLSSAGAEKNIKIFWRRGHGDRTPGDEKMRTGYV